MKENLREQSLIALYDSIDDFGVWLRLFLKSYGLVLRRRTKISQKLPKKTEELLENFNKYVINLRMEKSFVWFDMAGNFTVNQKGEKTVHIRGTGNGKKSVYYRSYVRC